MSRTHALLLVLLAAVAACTTYDEASVVPAASDAGREDGGLAVSPAPVADGGRDAATGRRCIPDPTAGAAACAQVTLYEPSEMLYEYPFAIVTDDRSVFWVSLTAPRSDPSASIEAYNGRGKPRIWRASKVAPYAPTLLYEGSAVVRAEALGLREGFVLLPMWTASSGTSTLVRVKSDCAGNCVPDPVPLGSVGPIRAIAPGNSDDWLLQADGPLYRYAAGAPLVAIDPVTRLFPTITRSSKHILIARNDGDSIARFALGEATQSSFVFPPLSNGQKGVIQIAADGAEVFALRADRTIWRGPSDDTTNMQLWVQGKAESVYGMALDASHVYLAVADAGGVFGLDRATGARFELFSGNVFGLAVDGQGVYWGNHRLGGEGTPPPGTIHMMVK